MGITVILPANWKEVRAPFPGQQVFGSVSGLLVLADEETKADGKIWRHVSISRHDSIPSWDDLRSVKDIFIGRQKEAIQKLPKESEYVNINPNVLHLWHCLDGPVTPDFTEGLGTI